MRLRHKLFVAMLTASVVVSVLVGTAAGRILLGEVQERYLERVRAECALVAWWITQAGDPENLHELAVSAGSRLGHRVTLIDDNGTVVGDSAHDTRGLARMDSHADRPEIRQALLVGSGQSRRVSRSTHETYYYWALRVEDRADVAVVRIAIPTYEMEHARVRFAWIGGLSVFVSLLVLSVAAYVAVRRLSKPIESLVEEAEGVAQGNRGEIVATAGQGEIARLGSAFNHMRDALVRDIDRVENERRVLSSVVSGIRDGLLVVDADLRVRIANDAFRQAFGVPIDPVGRILPEIVRSPAVIGPLEAAMSTGDEIRDHDVRAQESGRSFEVHVTPLPERPTGQPQGALALFFDITQLEALENVRREFVANVSHELRTPLTSIRAAVETLLDGDIDDPVNRERFLRIVQRHSGHMEALIDDLTDLSRIETGAASLAPADLSLRELAEDVVDRIDSRYPGLGVEIAVEVPDRFTITVDRLRMEQLLINLVDNAVKFNRAGGKVVVSAEAVGGKRVLRVADTGTGIPSESLEKIFHRFYRVDKARSKDVPGTGLGLSIVKHLMRLHGGTVRVVSEYGQGSTFILEFPARLPASEEAPAADGSTGPRDRLGP